MVFSQCLVDCRKDVCERLGIRVEDVELSMGMSNDFDKAVRSLENKLRTVFVVTVSLLIALLNKMFLSHRPLSKSGLVNRLRKDKKAEQTAIDK